MKFVQAMNYTKTNMTNRPIRLIVLHSMEMLNRPRGASDVANWFGGKIAPKYEAPRASAHFCVDAEEIVQCVKLDDVAWHASCANKDGIGIELAGFARQTSEQWLSGRNLAELKLAAKLVRFLCDKYDLPSQMLGVDEILKGDKGITTHAFTSLAYHVDHHTDPGGGFPYVQFLEFVDSADSLDFGDSPA